MLILKKYRFLAAAVIAFALLTFSAFAETGEFKNEYLDKMIAFGIIDEDAEFSEDEPVTRAEFTKYAVSALGFDAQDNAASGESPFTDIGAENEYYPYIVKALQYNLISRGGEFRPNDSIKSVEAAKILLAMTGYEPLCGAKGGYPKGYMSVASGLGILPSADENALVYPDRMLSSLWQAVNTKLMDFVAVKGGGIEYQNSEDKTVLTEYHSIYKDRGIVEENEYTSIYGASTVPDNCILVNSGSYNIGSTDADELIGYYTEYYYSYDEDTDKKTILYISEYDLKNDVLYVDGDDVNRGGISDNYFSYMKGDIAKNVKIAKNVSLLVNYTHTPFSADEFDSLNSDVVLIDNDSDGELDVIHIFKYEVIRVAAKAASNHSLTDDFTKKIIKLNPDDNSRKVKIIRDGVGISFDEISEDDIISVVESTKNARNIIKLYVSSESINGTVTAVEDDEITIDEAIYKNKCTKQLDAGMKGTFYLDFKGAVVWSTSGRDKVYGYLYRVYKDEDDVAHFKIFSERGRVVDLPLREKVRFNNESVKTSEYYDGFESGYRGLITYNVNPSGELTRFETPVTVEKPWSEEEKKLRESDTFRLSNYLKSAKYRNVGYFDGIIGLSGKSIIFMIHTENVQDEIMPDDITVVTMSEIEADIQYSEIYSYNADEMGIAGACMVRPSGRAMKNILEFMFVEGSYKTVNKDDEKVDGIKVKYGGESILLFASDDSVLTKAGGLVKGDIIYCGFDHNGYVSSITKCYNIKSGTEQQGYAGNWWGQKSTASGKIIATNPAESSIVVDCGTAAYAYKYTNKTKVYIMDKDSKKVETGSVDDILDGEFCFLMEDYAAVKDLVLFRSFE